MGWAHSCVICLAGCQSKLGLKSLEVQVQALLLLIKTSRDKQDAHSHSALHSKCVLHYGGICQEVPIDVQVSALADTAK